GSYVLSSKPKTKPDATHATLRPPRLSTWKTIPPGECRLGRDIHGFLPRYPSFVNLVAPGRPGWSPTQAPHKSVLAQLTHTAPRFNLRDPLSVVVSWTRPRVPMHPPCFPPTVS